jgi:sugar O-acyltransferase (sialic acid O-acetyltransferase NeuD family)
VPDFVIIGAGGFGREAHDVFLAIQNSNDSCDLNFIGFIDDGNPNVELLETRSSKLLGGKEVLLQLKDAHYVVAIADPKVRKKYVQFAEESKLIAQNLYHPSATFGFDVEVGKGSIICSHVSLTTNVRIGNHVHLNLNSTVGHDAELADFVTINPSVSLSGGVKISEGVEIGTQGVVLPNIAIGSYSIIGAGSVVTKNVPKNVTAYGVPAIIRR